jgi:putative ABC transport system ATP-binding protein
VPRGSPLLRVDDLRKTFRNGDAETLVLSGASLELARGEVTSLVGASGSGKSTLLSLIAGLLNPDGGRIVFDGEDMGALDDAAKARLRARRIGVVLQRDNLIPFLTARENVEVAIVLASGASPSRRAGELLDTVGLGDRVDRLPRRLSGGEAQRVAVAVALANEPDLLLADEPTGELDSATAEQVTGLILDARRERGLTVLIMTHSDELAERAQHRLRLEDGSVKAA